MKQNRDGLYVGILIIAVLVISYVLIRDISKVASNRGHHVYALFHDALGINERMRVLSAGLSVGQVEGRMLDPQTGKAKVYLNLISGFRLYENASISKKAISLLGEYCLEIDPGSSTEIIRSQEINLRELQEGDEILVVREPTEMDKIMDSVGESLPILKDILADVRHITSGSGKGLVDNVNQMLDKNSASVEHTLKHLDDVTAALAQGISPSELRNLSDGIEDFRAAMRDGRFFMGKLAKESLSSCLLHLAKGL
jgi:ABC-type transporter Mla subunit MlaD